MRRFWKKKIVTQNLLGCCDRNVQAFWNWKVIIKFLLKITVCLTMWFGISRLMQNWYVEQEMRQNLHRKDWVKTFVRRKHWQESKTEIRNHEAEIYVRWWRRWEGVGIELRRGFKWKSMRRWSWRLNFRSLFIEKSMEMQKRYFQKLKKN